MNQRQLRKTLASFYSKKFESGTDLLTHVVQQIVQHAGIEITGGRVWRLRTAAISYELVSQIGSVPPEQRHSAVLRDRCRRHREDPQHSPLSIRPLLQHQAERRPDRPHAGHHQHCGVKHVDEPAE